MKDSFKLEIQHGVVETLLTAAIDSDPEEFKAWLVGGIITNIVGNIPEAYWAQMMISNPCDKIGCDCHKSTKQTMAALDRLRAEHHEYSPKATAE
jgi:hypothetical protein